MAWIELHQDRQRHPKTLALAGALKISRREACGFLDDFWTWGLDVADRNGRLTGLSVGDIADVMDYPRKKGAWLMDALVKSGYVDVDEDGTFRIHDWEEYAGRLHDRREKDAIRKKEVRKKSAQCPADVQRTSTGCPGVTVTSTVTKEIRYDDEDEDARARDTIPTAGVPNSTMEPDPFNPVCPDPTDAACQRILVEFVTCGLAPPNIYTQDEIVNFLTLPEYGPTLESREGLILRAMKAAGEGKAQYRTWGGVKGLIGHWQKNGEGSAGRGASWRADEKRSGVVAASEPDPAEDERFRKLLESGAIRNIYG